MVIRNYPYVLAKVQNYLIFTLGQFTVSYVDWISYKQSYAYKKLFLGLKLNTARIKRWRVRQEMEIKPYKSLDWIGLYIITLRACLQTNIIDQHG